MPSMIVVARRRRDARNDSAAVAGAGAGAVEGGVEAGVGVVRVMWWI